MNTPPAKAGGFRLRLKAGLIGHSADGCRYTTLISLDADRVKGVFNTDEGAFGYNIAGESITQTELTNCEESRIEVISNQISDEWGRQLLECVN